MKETKVSADAYEAIDNLRNRFDNELAKELIADSMSTLAALIYIGRDEETISPWIDDLQKVMFTLSEYNNLVNAIAKEGEEPEKNEDISSKSDEVKKRIGMRQIMNELTIKSFIQAVQRYCEQLSRKPKDGTENLSDEEKEERIKYSIRDYYRTLEWIEMMNWYFPK